MAGGPQQQTRRGRRSSTAATASHSGLDDGKRPRRKINRGLTCANCRARKTRCDGGQPGCKTCEVYEDECRYDQLPPMSQIRSLTQRLQEAEATIRELQTGSGSSVQQTNSPSGGGSASGSPFDLPSQPITLDLEQAAPMVSGPFRSIGQSVDQNIELNRDSFWNEAGFPGLILPESTPHLTRRSPPPLPRTQATGATRSNVRAATDHELPTGGRDETGRGMTSDLSVDANGELCYYGPTSNVHETPAQSPDPILGDASSSRTDVRSLLTRNAVESRQWEEFALGNAAYHSEIPRDSLAKLLQTHWTWIAPTFMWVYRPAFMRDMSTGGKYFSQFLLTVLCAHSARFAEDPTIGEMLISRARLMLGTEIDKPLSIPTVQALLQLSARDLAYGRISQAWLYSGMAFRMVSDLGLHHSTSKIVGLGQLNPEDLEIRRRLFWSCYFWDKAISLYLGRMPVLNDVPPDAVPELLDDTTEHETWPPPPSSPDAPPATSNYPPQKSHAASCFINSCKLAVIINSIMLQLYSRRGDPDLNAVLPNLPNRLAAWRRDSPAHLVLDPDNLPQHSPPPNILTQNLLYFTTVILLHRPFHSSPSHRQTCRQAALHTKKLLLLLESSFGFTRITYLMAYCIYTSASVLLNDVNAGDREAGEGMHTLLRALRGGIATCPILQRSLDIITNNLRPPKSGLQPPSAQPRPQDVQSVPLGAHDLGADWFTQDHTADLSTLFGQHENATTYDPSGTIPTSLLPAFLFSDGANDSAAGLFSGALANDPFSALDCFPENRMDGLSNDWFTDGL